MLRKPLCSCFALILYSLGALVSADEPVQPQIPKSETTELPEITVVGKLDHKRNKITPRLGTDEYAFTAKEIAALPQGANATFNQVLIRAPGVAQDSYGQIHIRGEHANLQYRINGVLLPEGLSGFGQELDTRFVDSVSLLTGALPAQFGYRTAGVVDIRTKSGTFHNGGSGTMSAGSFSTVKPSFEYGANSGALNYYFTGGYVQNDLGIENPTNAPTAIHDRTYQYKGFSYLSYVIDDTSRLSAILSSSGNWFQIPDSPGLPQVYSLAGTPNFPSASLNENQTELNDYAILSYQKSFGSLDMQVAAFGRFSSIYYVPDQAGDLIFNGVSSTVDRSIASGGMQLDLSLPIVASHTLRFGGAFTAESSTTNTNSVVFPANSSGAQTSTTPIGVVDDNSQLGFIYGIYVQDEWKPFDALTINFGLRFDGINAFANEYQVSPRANATFKATDTTTVHGGYSRYFTPPPLELVNAESVAKFNNTTNASAITQSSVVLSERAHYFDMGITQQVFSLLQLGLDGYYKLAESQLDEGQFGQALIYSPFNYQSGDIHGLEFSASLKKGGLSAYANLAFSQAEGKQITSGEFQFNPQQIAYINSNWVHLDHDQFFTGSFGASYAYNATTLYTDILVGSGLRNGFANTGSLPPYVTWNLGIKNEFNLPEIGTVQARFDIVNLADSVYELRDGTGIGVFAPQFGQRLSFFGSLTVAFGGSST